MVSVSDVIDEFWDSVKTTPENQADGIRTFFRNTMNDPTPSIVDYVWVLCLLKFCELYRTDLLEALDIRHFIRLISDSFIMNKNSLVLNNHSCLNEFSRMVRFYT